MREICARDEGNTGLFKRISSESFLGSSRDNFSLVFPWCQMVDLGKCDASPNLVRSEAGLCRGVDCTRIVSACRVWQLFSLLYRLGPILHSAKRFEIVVAVLVAVVVVVVVVVVLVVSS